MALQRPLQYHPFAAPLDKLLQEHGKIGEDEAEDIKAEKLGCMSRTELQPDLCLVRGPESRVFNLSRDFVYIARRQCRFALGLGQVQIKA